MDTSRLDTTDILNYSNLSPASQSFEEQIENDEYFEDNGTIYEIENQFILRMPSYKDGRIHSSCNALREALGNENSNLKERLFIDLNPETRLGTLKFDEQIFKGKLVDLPCIIESLKTVEKKTFYKTADICQMFILRPPDEDNLSADDEAEKIEELEKIGEVSKKFQYPHGITPPLKNVRRKRFRKIAKKKVVDYVEIEKEVKRLFRADRDATKVEYEVITVDEPQEQKQAQDKKLHKKSILHKISKPHEIMDDSTLGGHDIHSPGTFAESSNDASIFAKPSGTKHDFLGDISSSSESDFEDFTEKKSFTGGIKKTMHFRNDSFTNQNSFEAMDIGDESTNMDAPSLSAHNEDSNIMYSEQTTSNAANLLGEDLSESLSNDVCDDGDESERVASSPIAFKVNQMKLDCLIEELKTIQDKKKKQEDEINQISNPVLKGRLLPILNEIIEEEKQKKNEIDQLKSKMNG